MPFNELPPETPRWRILLANVGVLVCLGGLYAGHHYLGLRFTFGVILGILLMQVAHRVSYGRWINWGMDGQD